MLETFRTTDNQEAIVLDEYEQPHDARIILVAVPTSPTPFIVWRQFQRDVEQLYWGDYCTTLKQAQHIFVERCFKNE